ncbi:BMP family lipoprotein [Pseudoclavibacter albus]|uniref:BMP family lipoprotein n=1 Tax=Pseudoclavibacter albus TaxID=272241 RepID=UPI000825B72B|nr:BMP family ABC transporter substrate-binding protein [Pseudoclavibacter alba]
MNTQRVFASVAAAAIAALTLSSCQAAPATEGGVTGAKSDLHACMVANSGNIQDRSFNQAVHESLEAAKTEYGIQTSETVSQSPDDYTTNLDAMANAGCDYIVTVGWELADATKAAAAAHPEIAYSIVDEIVEGDNVRSIVHDTAQAAFLAGYLSAGLTKTGTIGTFGGGNQPPVTVFMDGYQAGMEYYNKAKGKDIKLVGWDAKTQKGSFTDDFTNSSTARTVAAGLISQGADIIMPVAAQAGEGAVMAAKEHGDDIGIVWVDADGYNLLADDMKPYLVTTVEKHMKPAILEVMKSKIDGNFTGGNTVGTLENEGVGLAPYHDWDSKVPAELRAEIDDLKAKIASGEIKVESQSSPKIA